MVTLEAGTRILLTCDGTRTTLRTLAAAPLDGPWELPVLAAVTGLRDGTGTIEVATARGLLALPARLTVTDAGLTLRAAPGAGDAPVRFRQRRQDVRGALELALLCAILPDGDPGAEHGPVRTGLTTSVSGGGVGLLLHTVASGPGRAPTPVPGDLVHLELHLDPQDPVPAVAEVVDAAPVLRARFVRIAPLDRERLVRAVFEAERQALARAAGRPSTR